MDSGIKLKSMISILITRAKPIIQLYNTIHENTLDCVYCYLLLQHIRDLIQETMDGTGIGMYNLLVLKGQVKGGATGCRHLVALCAP